jgi:hypothetical protein
MRTLRPNQTFLFIIQSCGRPPDDDWDWREGRRPRAPCRVPDGRGSGLWNQRHVEEAHDSAFLNVFESLTDQRDVGG